MSLLEQPFLHLRKAAPYRAFWLCGPLLLYVWTLGGPFVSDDLLLLLKAEKFLAGETDDWRLYRFAATDEEWNAMRERGTIPWWLPDTGRLDFLRPISEASFLLDVRLFGRKVFSHRMMSLAIFAAALCCVHWMFMQAAGDRVRAGVATFFFGISQTVAPPVTWLCNRQDLLVVIGVTLAAGAYWSLRRTPSFRCLLLALGAFVFALFSKEVAIAVAGVICVHELIARRSKSARAANPMTAAVAVGMPAIAAAYLAYYIVTRPWLLDFDGTDGGPTQFGTQLPLSLLLYAAVWTVGFPIDVLHTASDAQKWIVALAGGAIFFITLRYLRRSTHGDHAALFFAIWAILFVLPGLRALTASSRTLCTATIGWAYLLSTLLVPTRPTDKFAPLLYRQFILAANGIVSVGCVIGTVLVLTGTERAACDRLNEITATLQPALQDDDVLIVAEARSQFEMICAGERLEFLTGRRDVRVHYLQPPGVDADLSVFDENTLMMTARSGSLLGAPMHRLTRGDAWLAAPNERFTLRAFTAEVAELDADGNVTQMRFNFPNGLRSTGLHFHPPDLPTRDRNNGGSAPVGGAAP